MLTRFAVKNYRGFSERLEWNLSNPNNYEYNGYAIKDGIIKNGIVYGPNGSGKTNFSLALFDIENHLSQKWKKADYYTNFVYAGKKEQLVEFEYVFQFEAQSVRYHYSKNSEGQLMTEMLHVDEKRIFDRQISTFEIDTELFPMDENVIRNLSNNANKVSIVNFLLTSYPLNANHFLIKLKQFVEGMLWFRNLDVREFIGLETKVVMLEEYIISNHYLEEFKNFLKNVSGQNFEMLSDASGKQILCKIDDTVIPFQTIASTGTQSLQLLFYWIKRMGNEASFVFIDEFDAFYHFRLSFEVCKLLFNLDCQIFTSSHNTYLMTNDLLRPDCNFILKDNKIKPMKDCTDKDLRFGHNIEKLFRGNAFQV